MSRPKSLAYVAVLLTCVVYCGAAFGLAVDAFDFTKVVDKTAVTWGDEVTYTYTISNNSTTGSILRDVTIMDDNGTPDDPGDDFLVGQIAELAPGQTRIFTVTKLLTPLCSTDDGGNPLYPGSLDVEVLANGNVRFTYNQSPDINDNTYGANASEGWKNHKFEHLVNSDHVVFSVTDGNGDEVLNFATDYVSPSGDFPSGYGCLGVAGEDGSMNVGNPAHIVYAGSSLADNLNQSSYYAGFTTDSPAPPDPNWDYFMRYTIEVDAAAFGANGFGSVSVVEQHNSPAKTDEESVYPEPCERCITNTAVVTATKYICEDYIGEWTASDTATVCVFLDGGMYDVSGTVYFDYNAQLSTYDAGATWGLTGVPVELRALDGRVVGTVETSGAINEDGIYVGNYSFKSVPANNYNIVAPLSVRPKNLAATVYAFNAPLRAVSLSEGHRRGVDFGYSLHAANLYQEDTQPDGSDAGEDLDTYIAPDSDGDSGKHGHDKNKENNGKGHGSE